MDKKILKDRKRLAHFIRRLRLIFDTPSLIQLVAEDADYLILCGAIVNATAGDGSKFFQLLTAVCRQQDLEFKHLQERLTPVARALGLTLSSKIQLDYYDLLEIPWDASGADIKKAFRKKAHGVHPDTSSQGHKSSHEFIELQTAYQILSDPVLRQQYDQSRQRLNLWKEKTNHVHRFRRLHGLYTIRRFLRFNPQISRNTNQNRPARTKIFYQLGSLFLFLILAAFIFDFFYQQNTILDGIYSVTKETGTKSIPEKSPPKIIQGPGAKTTHGLEKVEAVKEDRPDNSLSKDQRSEPIISNDRVLRQFSVGYERPRLTNDSSKKPNPDGPKPQKENLNIDNGSN